MKEDERRSRYVLGAGWKQLLMGEASGMKVEARVRVGG
jgi:hypothetical protein